MKMDVRASVALCLLTVTATAAAQNASQEQTVPGPPAPPPSASPPPAPSAQPTPPPAPQVTAPAPAPQQNVQPPPATPPLPRLPSQQYQYTPAPQSPPPAQYQYQYTPPPSAPPTPAPSSAPLPQHLDNSRWSHTETTHTNANTGFQYRPFRFHIDGGGTLTTGSTSSQLNSGWNAGFGFSWFPTSYLPLGVRVDGTYNEFEGRTPLLNQATATYGTRVDNATQKLYGGDVDLELDSYFSPYVRMYLLAGGGWYRQQTTFRQTNYYPGLLCDWWGCIDGYYGVDSTVARNTTKWTFSENAGIGFEFAMGPATAFFVEARYQRLDPHNSRSDFIPIRAGLRF